MKTKTTGTVRKMTQIAILAALVIVLQFISYSVKIGIFTLSLALIPIAVGAILFGPAAGAGLGATFGAVTLIGCISGIDTGGAILWGANPILTAVLCLVKGAAAGLCAALIAKALSRYSFVASMCAAITVPIVNTGLFCLAMACLYHDILVEWSGGANLLYYVIFSLIGGNFLFEFLTSLVLSPAVARIIRAVSGSRSNDYT